MDEKTFDTADEKYWIENCYTVDDSFSFKSKLSKDTIIETLYIYADVTTICPTGIGTTYACTGATTSIWYTCFNEKKIYWE